jgi:glycosyltransferase involved in cell wall biosynthesis
MQQQDARMRVSVARRKQGRRGHQPAILARCGVVAIALVTNVLAPYRVPLYSLLAERYDVEVLCFGAGASYVPEWFGDLDGQLAAAPFPARRIAGPRAALALGKRYHAAIAPVAGGAMLPATYLGMRRRGRPFVLWGSVWAHPRGGAMAALGFPLVRHVYRHADAVVTYGEHVRRYVARYRGHDDDVVIAPQSVEAELFGRPVADEEIAAWRAEAGLPADGPLVLYVGRLVEEKGLEELLAAWRMLAAADGPPPATAPSPLDAQRHVVPPTLAVVGDGPLAGEVAATPGVRLLGPLPRERLPVAYAAADSLVLPSIPTPRFREPWGLVCNEALHQGTPVIATTAVGAVVGGLVRHDETGLVVPPGDPAALASAIRRLLANRPLRERLGATGREALTGHTYAAMADAFGMALARAGALR